MRRTQKTPHRAAGEETALAAAWRASAPGLAAVVVFGAAVNLLKFALPLYLLQVLDRIPASRSVETLALLTLMALAALSAGAALDIVRRRMLTHWGYWIERRFGPELVARGLGGGASARRPDLDAALSDLARIRAFVTRSLAAWLDVAWVPVFLLGVALVHPWLGGLALAACLALVALAVVQDAVSVEPRRASGAAGRDAGALLAVADRHRESIGALGMSPALAERWSNAAAGRLAERERLDRDRALFRGLMRALGQAMRLGMIGLGMWLFLRGELTLGGVFAARVMAGFGFSVVEGAARSSRALGAARRGHAAVRAALAVPPAPAPDLHPGTDRAALRVEDVTHRHPGQRRDLFRRLSLRVAPGEMLLISGEGGMGKTTLAHLIVGIESPRHGRVFLGDTDVAILGPEDRARLIGYLPQHVELFAGSVRENIAGMERGSLVDVTDAARLAGVHDLILGMPEGYDTPLSPETFDRLSGSQRKRIAIARAFHGAPRLVLLDEPWANLDAPSRKIVEAGLRHLKAAGAIVVVTQSYRSGSLHRLADTHLILDADGFGFAPPARAERPARGALRRVK
ncbi:ATP-binding cassette domain-containing protein [Rhodovulum sp. 12E13]|uniref:ATP-binding cassette domain-containing protein n=1 Tax=Rhodovulum sp. 12E13 TaxID=2203891 RepID=UPI000E173C51|nr:ATP-binding cassette domain-containing protein [Rhodovulum sp. 12E13]RDC74160.1 ATP-binding cassette domain-containing protein [Rhodovulum sp. 12E13]